VVLSGASKLLAVFPDRATRAEQPPLLLEISGGNRFARQRSGRGNILGALKRCGVARGAVGGKSWRARACAGRGRGEKSTRAARQRGAGRAEAGLACFLERGVGCVCGERSVGRAVEVSRGRTVGAMASISMRWRRQLPPPVGPDGPPPGPPPLRPPGEIIPPPDPRIPGQRRPHILASARPLPRSPTLPRSRPTGLLLMAGLLPLPAASPKS